jgi:hypothetical protein
MIRHLCVGSLLLLVVACSGDLSGPRSEAGLVLEASLSSPSIEEGQIDTLTVTLTNTNPVPITLHFNSGCQILPYVTDAGGDMVVPSDGGWACTLNLSSRTVAPHESQSVEFVWTGGLAFAPGPPTQRLPRGTYRVFARLDSREVRLATERIAVELR